MATKADTAADFDTAEPEAPTMPSVRTDEDSRLDEAREALAAARGRLGEFAADDGRAQTTGGNIIQLAVGVAVAVLVTVGVAVPIINDVVAGGNLSTIEQTIAGFISTILILVVFMAAASPIMGR